LKDTSFANELNTLAVAVLSNSMISSIERGVTDCEGNHVFFAENKVISFLFNSSTNNKDTYIHIYQKAKPSSQDPGGEYQKPIF